MAEIAHSADVSSAVLAETDIPALISKLHPLLPYPLPLYRRLQFHLKHPNRATARAFLALASPTSPQTWLHSPDVSPARSEIPFLAAHIDLACAGETQIYTFASWEVPIENGLVEAADEVKTSLLNALFHTLATQRPFIPSSPADPPESHQLLTRTKKLVTPYSPSKVLFGALHSVVFDCIPRQVHVRDRTRPGYVKYIFTPNEDSLAHTGDEYLPEGYRFGPIKHDDEHLNLVLSRTNIPRTLPTLRQLGSVGIFHDAETVLDSSQQGEEEENADHITHDSGADGADIVTVEKGDHTRTARETELSANAIDANSLTDELAKLNTQPVAWGFLGKDASLSSLHVEPRHRGKGLAGAVTRRLFAMQDELFGGEEGVRTRMGHADVDEENAPSRRVMEKLEGVGRWLVAWVEVDVSRLVSADASVRRGEEPDVGKTQRIRKEVNAA